jgi:adenylosuccinate lyase
MLEAMVQIHERDGRGWKAEWPVFPELCLLTSSALALAIDLVRGLEVRVGRMRANVEDDQGLLLSSMSFSIADKTRRDAEDRVTQQAIQAWQARAQQAAQALGFAKWRVGHVSVQTSGPQAVPMMRAQAMTAMAAPPVALEAGTTDVNVTVSGDAVLDTPR